MRVNTEIRFTVKDGTPLKDFIEILQAALILHGQEAVILGPGDTIGSSKMLLICGEKK
jgi:hypothetical protein